MDAIRNKVLGSKELYEDEPAVLRCLGIPGACIKCKHDVLERAGEVGAAPSALDDASPEKRRTQLPGRKIGQAGGKRQNSALSVSDRLVLNRLKLFDFPRLAQQSLAKADKKDADDLPDTYLRFANSIDLSPSKMPVTSFDLSVFFDIFNSGFVDETISAFIDRFLADPHDHAKKDRVSVLYVAIFVYVYCKRNKMDVRMCRKKIEEHTFLFRPLCRFDIQWQNDPFIDKFVIHLRRNSHDMDEAIFLNQIYLARAADKTTFDVFHRRMVDALMAIPEFHVFSFLQHVFTYSTVMFSCIDETHLHRLIISYYKNMNRCEQLASLLEVLTNKVDDPGLNETLVAQFQGLNLATLRYRKQCLAVEVRQFRSIGEYKDFFLRNRESFSGLTCGFGELTRLYGMARDLKRELEVLDVLFYLFDNIKLEFLPSFIKQFITFLIEVLCGVTCFDERFLEFNRLRWKTLSNIVLVAQRLGMDGREGGKKKKDGSIRLSEISKLVLKLVAAASEVEAKAAEGGGKPVTTLKKRGFRIS